MAINVDEKYTLIYFGEDPEELDGSDTAHHIHPDSLPSYEIEPPFFGIPLTQIRTILIPLSYRNGDLREVYGPVTCILCEDEIHETARIIYTIIYQEPVDTYTLSNDAVKNFGKEHICPQCDEKVIGSIEQYIEEYPEDIAHNLL